MTAETRAVLRARPKATILAVLLVCAGVTLSLAHEALAYTFSCSTSPCGFQQHIDTDRNVPESSGSPSGSHYDLVLGRTTYVAIASGENVGYVYNDYIVYDYVEINRCNLTAYQGLVVAHEHAHSRGWSHYDGTPERNAAYYPKIKNGAVSCNP